jgi:hypothetical protein
VYTFAEDSLSRIALNSTNVPVELSSMAIDEVKKIALSQLGANVSEVEEQELAQTLDVYGTIAKEISIFKNEARLDSKLPSQVDLPILSYMPPYLADRTDTKTTDLRVLQQKNPLLALAFLRIRDLNSAQVQQLISEIEKIIPNSPEIATLTMADRMRTVSLAQDPITFGQNQGLISMDNVLFSVVGDETTIGDVRMRNAREMLERFGQTALYKKIEIETLKASDSTATQAQVFAAQKAELENYNLAHPDKQINPMYLDMDLNSVNPDLNTFLKLSKSFPDIELSNYDLVKKAIDEDVLKNAKIEPLPARFNLASGAGRAYQLLIANDLALNPSLASQTKKSYTHTAFFDSKGSYFYTKGQPGKYYQNTVRKLLPNDPGVIIKNIDIDQYMAIDPSGQPIYDKYGQYQVYSARFLEAHRNLMQERKSEKAGRKVETPAPSGGGSQAFFMEQED